MILRRFMKHVSDQNWFAVGLDVLVVITGIFLGMQVTDWNEAREAVQQEAFLLDQLEQDLEESLETLNNSLTHGRNAILASTWIVERLDFERGGVGKPPQWSRGAVVFEESMRAPGIRVNMSSLSQIAEGGKFTLIQDKVLRQKIIGMVASVKARQAWSESVVPSFVNGIGALRGKTGPDVNKTFYEADNPSTDFGDASVSFLHREANWQQLAADPSYRESLSQHIQRQEYMYSMAQSVRDDLVELVALVRASRLPGSVN